MVIKNAVNIRLAASGGIVCNQLVLPDIEILWVILEIYRNVYIMYWKKLLQMQE